MEVVISILSLIALVVVLILEIRRPSNVIPVEERIANTKRVITNLIPIALLLVTNAEYLYSGKTGPFKRSYVIDELYKRIPDEYKKYIKEENLDVIINTVLTKAEDLWNENPQLVGRT